MRDMVLKSFLAAQHQEGMALAGQSDLVELLPSAASAPPDRYLARFTCKGLIRDRDGQIREASEFLVEIWFPSHYLRHVDPWETLTFMGPLNTWHPNINAPAICVGRIAPGTGLVDLVYQIYEMITYFHWVPQDPLNPEAAQWARNHQQIFPIDRRPLKRRVIDLKVPPRGREARPS